MAVFSSKILIFSCNRGLDRIYLYSRLALANRLFDNLSKQLAVRKAEAKRTGNRRTARISKTQQTTDQVCRSGDEPASLSAKTSHRAGAL